MQAKQKQAIETYQRVQDFLTAHPPPESPGYLAQKKALDGVVATLDDHSVNQAMGRRLSRAEVARQRALRKALRQQHLAPIAQIARATLSDAPGIEKALKMPPSDISPLKLVAEANAMRSAAALYQPQFIEAGRPADFLEQLDAAAEALRQALLGKARNVGRQVGAGAGIDREIKRGRRAIEVIDTIVTAAFRDDQNVLATWRSAKRVRAVPGGKIPVSDVAPNLALVAAAPASPVSSSV
jgi:hypothetical protein